jgi:methylglutaconyl-CoA hydratase
LRRYALTGERFGAAEAHRIGLVHGVVPAADLASAGEAMVARLLENAPQAMAETKECIIQSSWGGFDQPAFDALVTSHAAKRRSPEAAEGLASFAEKRAARWGQDADARAKPSASGKDLVDALANSPLKDVPIKRAPVKVRGKTVKL